MTEVVELELIGADSSYAAADELIAASRSDATRTAYRGDWTRFGAWCARHGIDARTAQPDHIAAYE